jgi:oxygen-dependent protoporphyrinogen oxidase
MVAAVRQDLRDILGVEGEPSLSRIARWPDSMPQYEIGHLHRVERIEKHAAAYPGLAIAGNAYRGVGIPDCIASGERAAETLFGAHATALPSAAA